MSEGRVDGVPAPGERSSGPEPAGRWGPLPSWWRRAVLFLLAAVVGLQIAEWGFAELGWFLGLLFLAWLFALTVEPVVGWLSARGMRRGAATGIVLAATIVLVVAFFGLFGTLLVNQVAQLVHAVPELVQSVVGWANSTFHTHLQTADIVSSLKFTPQRIQQLTPSVLGVVSSVAGVVARGLTLLLFAFYMSAEAPALRDAVASWFPPRHQRVVATVWDTAAQKTGGYVLSRVVLGALSSVSMAVALLVLHVPYWLPLALWTGIVSQFVPTIGTYLAIGLPALVALAQRPITAVWVIAWATVYQQIENYVLAPRVTARTMSVHPAVAFGSVVVGVSLFGPLGAFVAIPVAAAIVALIDTYGHRYELAWDGAAPPIMPEPRAPTESPGGALSVDTRSVDTRSVDTLSVDTSPPPPGTPPGPRPAPPGADAR
jgi:predicted PurR-regulated permease PerM